VRRYLFPTIAAAVLVLVTFGIFVTERNQGGALDPRSVAPDGAKALAQVLRDRGVTVTLVTDDAKAQELARPDTTVLVAAPDRLPRLALHSLITSGARVVVVAPTQSQLDDADIPLDEADTADPATRQPECSDPIALRAGVTVAGGLTYDVREGTGCYAVLGAASYVALNGGRLVILGTGAPLTNADLDREGDAALALLLLGQGDQVVWLLPEAAPLASEGEGSSLTSLLPHQVKVAVLALGVATLVLGLVRGRRLGRVVPEALPVVVRSAETVEGTARLYRSAGARDRAAEALRASVRDRLRRVLAVPPEHRPEALVDAVAARTPRDPGQVAGLLYGLAPSDDSALVALADALDALDLEVRRP